MELEIYSEGLSRYHTDLLERVVIVDLENSDIVYTAYNNQHLTAKTRIPRSDIFQVVSFSEFFYCGKNVKEYLLKEVFSQKLFVISGELEIKEVCPKGGMEEALYL